MKVLHLIDSGGVYGAEQVLLTLFAGLPSRGHEPILGSLRAPGEPARPIEMEARRQGVQVWPIEVDRPFGGRAMRTLADRAARDSIKVIHSHGYKANILNGARLARRHTFATMATLHGWTGVSWRQRVWWYQRLEREFLLRLDAIAVVRRGMLGGRLARPAVAGRTRLIPNGIPSDAGTGADLAQDSGQLRALREFCGRAPTIGFVGRLSTEKGAEILLQAFAKLREGGADLQLVIVGDGPLRDALCRLAAELGVSQRVLFAGFVPRAAVVLPWFRILAMPSLQEGLPIVLLEAMRARLSIVASAVGGIPEALEEGKGGRLVPPRQPQALAAAIEALLKDPGAEEALRQHAFARFNAHYTEDSMVSSYAGLYERLAHHAGQGVRT